MRLPLKRQDAAALLSTIPAIPATIHARNGIPVNRTHPSTTFPSSPATPVQTGLNADDHRAALAFKILVPIAVVILCLALCYIWGPRGYEWCERRPRHPIIEEQQRRLTEARTAAAMASFPMRTASGVAPGEAAVVRVHSSSSLPAYEREAGRGEVVLGIGAAIGRDVSAEREALHHRTDSAVTLTAVPPYVFTSPSAAGSRDEPPTPTTPTSVIAPRPHTPTGAAAHAPADQDARAPSPGPPTSGPPSYRRTRSSVSLPRLLSSTSLTRLRTGAPGQGGRGDTPPGSPSTPTGPRNGNGAPAPAYAPSLPSVPQAALAPAASSAVSSASVVGLSAPPFSPRRRLSPLVPTPSGTFSLL